MFVNERARMVYLAHAHTGSTATALTLMRERGFKEPRGGWHHRRLHDPKSPMRERDLCRWIAFTGVRNTYDLAVSWVFSRSPAMPDRQGPTFDLAAFEFSLRDSYYIRAGKLFGMHTDDADEIVRAESLSEDVSRVLALRGMKPVQVPLMNADPRRAGRPYSHFYTDDTRQYVAQRFAAEIERYGYTYEEEH